MKNEKALFSEYINKVGGFSIDLKKYYPLGELKCKFITKVEYKYMNQWKTLPNPHDFANVTARYITVFLSEPAQLEIIQGIGYIAEDLAEYTEEFFKHSGWTGADGIFTFNIKNGNDYYNQTDAKTLFVFGDTLVGYVDDASDYRVAPVLMPNNTIAYLDGNNPIKQDVDFRINTNEFDTVTSFFDPDNSSIYDGTVPSNIIKYDDSKTNNLYLSGYNPKTVDLVFDFHGVEKISKLELFNYFDEKMERFNISRRGIKETIISTSNDGESFTELMTLSFQQRTRKDDFETIDIDQTCQYIKFQITPKQGIGNHYDPTDKKEILFGLDMVKFYNETGLLQDVSVEATSILDKKKSETWFWLQDGVVIDNAIYFTPLLVGPDLTKPEGLQFQVKGVSMLKIPIRNQELEFSSMTQHDTALCYTEDDSQWLFGNAFMSCTKQAGHPNPDGYIYIYGYHTIKTDRYLKVARVKAGQFENGNKWEFYSNGTWKKDMLQSSSILEHISCEMSVSPIAVGPNKGKYIAVFTYDVNTPKIAYSIGKTPWGPFTEPQIVYESNEPNRLGKTAYAYNAKAHPHLSKEDEIIVTYNINTYSMEHNIECSDVYHPRFIKLIATTKE